MAYWRGSTTPLKQTGGSPDTWTSQVGLRERHDTVTGTVKTDQNGTLHVEQSSDGVNWDFDTTVAVTASTGASFNINLVGPYWRLRFVNTAGSDQTFLRISATTQAGGDS